MNIAELTNEQLDKLAMEREEWARDTKERDLHGSAREWLLTAALARELVNLRHQFVLR